jgi:hypothetical protein
MSLSSEPTQKIFEFYLTTLYPFYVCNNKYVVSRYESYDILKQKLNENK